MGKLDQIRALREARHEERSAKPVNNENVINKASTFEDTLLTPKAVPVSTNAERQAKWRKANSELNKLRAREGMRKKRARKTAEGTNS